MAETEGFEIAGKTYPVPTVDTFDIAEARILKRYSGVVLEDFAPVHPEAEDAEKAAWEKEQGKMLSDPDFKAAFAHIAFRRGNPEREYEEIAAIVDGLNLVNVTLALFEEEDASPPELTVSASEPESETDSKQPSRPSASGPPLTNGLDSPEETPASTGTSELATSSPVSLVATSAN